MDKGFLSYIKENKKMWKIFLAIALGIFLISLSSFNGGEKTSVDSAESLDEYKERLEGEIANLCSEIDGVGKCKVFITFERGAQNNYKGSSVIETKPPKILGVSVICEGADSDRVEMEIKKIIFDSQTNMEAAIQIARVLPEIKTDMMIKVFSSIKKGIIIPDS